MTKMHLAPINESVEFIRQVDRLEQSRAEYQIIANEYKARLESAEAVCRYLRGEVERLQRELDGEIQGMIAELEANACCTCGYSDSCRECNTGKYQEE